VLRVVTGPPAAGKSTYVRDNAEPGDVVIDLDALAVALGSPDPHDHPPAIAAAAHAARNAVIASAKTARTDTWLIHSVPDQAALDSYAKQGADIIAVDPGEDVVRQRIEAERPAAAHAVADRWYSPDRTWDDATHRTVNYWATSGAKHWIGTSDPEAALREKLAAAVDEGDLDAMVQAVLSAAGFEEE